MTLNADEIRRTFAELGNTMAEAVETYEAKLETANALVTCCCGSPVDTPSPVDHVELSISALQRAHIERQEEWCPDQKPDLSFRGNELGGECGEAQNVIKKLERERHGWRGSRDTIEHLGEELADVIHCAVLVAITAGSRSMPAVIAKFNSTSEKNGLATMLRCRPQVGGQVMVYGDYNGPDKADKGKEGGSCNRRRCQCSPARWYNHGSFSWYCDDCRAQIEFDPINSADWQRTYFPRLQHPMFETREMMDARSQPPTKREEAP